MDTLATAPVAGVLTRLFDEAATADSALMAQFADEWGDGDPVAEMLAREAADYRGLYREFADNYLNVSAEFGTSFGVSTIHLAAALRDNGGGHLVGTELESAKARRASENLAAAGRADIVDVRVGDALEALLGENASGDYLSYVRDPANGYRSVPLPFEPGRGNELSVRTA